MKKCILLLIILLICICLINCNSTNTNNNSNISNNTEEKNNDQNDTKEVNLASSINQFAIDMFNSIEKEVRTNNNKDKQNIFISPMSIYIALSMTNNGAGASLREGISNVLYTNDYQIKTVNNSIKNIINTLEDENRNIQLLIANSIWQSNIFSILDSFKNILINYYNATIEKVDFGNPKTKDIINEWISNNTNNLINNMIESTKPDDVLYLINAIYFYGQWLRKFEKDLTNKQDFILLNGEKISTNMMNADDQYLYYEDIDFSAIRLSYGKLNKDLTEDEIKKQIFLKDEFVSMYIFLPKENNNIYNLIDNFNIEKFENVITQMNPEKLILGLPKFKIDFGGEYKEILDNLQNLGMPTTNDFSNMTNEPDGLFISKVLHQAIVEVNEEGTEAAAATVVTVKRTIKSEPKEFIANKPFLFIIRDDKTNTILFMGILKDPTN
jgi:serpin B